MKKVRGNYVEFDPENVGTRRAALLELAFPFQNATVASLHISSIFKVKKYIIAKFLNNVLVYSSFSMIPVKMRPELMPSRRAEK